MQQMQVETVKTYLDNTFVANLWIIQKNLKFFSILNAYYFPLFLDGY